MKLCLLFLLSFLLQIGFAQNKDVNKKLDSIINHIIIGKPLLIQVNNGVVFDTLNIIKVKVKEKDTSIIVKFSNNKSKSIKAKYFWGQVSDFGERRRFYEGRSYIFKKTTAPYIYKQYRNNDFNYYFSETLTGKIIPLTTYHIDTYASTNEIKMILYNYSAKYGTDKTTLRLTDGNFKENAKETAAILGETLLNIITSDLFFWILSLFDN